MTLHILVPELLIRISGADLRAALTFLSTLKESLNEFQQQQTLDAAQGRLYGVQRFLDTLVAPEVKEPDAEPAPFPDDDDGRGPFTERTEVTPLPKRVGPDEARGRPRSPPSPTQPLGARTSHYHDVREVLAIPDGQSIAVTAEDYPG